MNLPHLCAKISALAYRDNPRPGLLELGFALIRQYVVDGTQAILVTNYQDVIFAPRGTEPDEWRDWFTDLSYIKIDFPGGGRVHLGFYLALMRIWDQAMADMKELPYPRVYTGHSLGAAIALEAAVLWPPRQTLVYGCPKVGNNAFAKRMPRDTVRYENWIDPVTFIPPRLSPWQAYHAYRHHRKPTAYVHAGQRVRLPGLGHSVYQYVNSTADKS